MKLIPIAVVAFNRPKSVERVLRSLEKAHIPEGVPLHLFVDGGGPNGTAELCRSFDWPRGEKHLHVAGTQLGMRENSLRAGDLALTEGGVIFLEDDSTVAPYFYQFAQAGLSRYSSSTVVNAISLYSFEFCEFDQLRFQPIIDGYDNYFVASATTWAVVFPESGWSRFKGWLKKNGSSAVRLSDGVPGPVTAWPSTSWKRYLNKYLAASGELFCYPRTSYAMNFADAGSHFVGGNSNYRVPISYGLSNINLSEPHASAAKYDPFFELQGDLLAKYIGVDGPDFFDVDLRAIKTPCQLRAAMTLSIRQQASPIRKFGISSFPLEANVIERSEGSVITYGPRLGLRERTNISRARLSRYYHHDLGGNREVNLILDRVRSSLLPLRG